MAISKTPVAEGYLTIPQAADCLGIPTNTLRRAVNKGLVPLSPALQPTHPRTPLRNHRRH